MIVLDTNVLLYAVGTDHPLAQSGERFMAAVIAGRIQATTTFEVLAEFVHVRARRRSRADATSLARAYRSLLSPLLTVTDPVFERGLELFEQHPRLGAFDAVLAAAALENDAETLVSTDRDFRAVKELRFVELGSAELDELIGSG